VVVGAGVERVDDDVGARGQEDDRKVAQRRVAADLAAQRQAVAARHGAAGDQEVGRPPPAEAGEGGVAVGHDLDRVAVGGERVTDGRPGEGVVLRHQHLHPDVPAHELPHIADGSGIGFLRGDLSGAQVLAIYATRSTTKTRVSSAPIPEPGGGVPP
jgi:hypothetical protein